jgi:hypothetical protein
MRLFFALPGLLQRLASRSLRARVSAPRRGLALRLCLALCVLTSSLAAHGSALAQDDKARARSLFAEGVEAFDRGDFENALESFTQAYRLAPHPAVRVNMANCYEQLGRFAEATFNYQRFLEESGNTVSPEQRVDVEQAIERLARKFGTLLVVTDPEDVSLSVDGVSAARGLDGRMQLRAGQHLLRATKPGYQSVERSVDVQGGVEQQLNLELEQILSGAPVPASSDFDEEITSGSDERESEPGQGPKRSGKLRSGMWIALGAGALLGIGAGITGGLALKGQKDFEDAVSRSNSTSAQATERARARSDGLDAADRADRMSLLSDALLVGAVAGAGTAFVLWLIDRKHNDREPSMSLAPAAGARGQLGLALRGAF